jgi:GMP synthase-like glutamine amidotransferase
MQAIQESTNVGEQQDTNMRNSKGSRNLRRIYVVCGGHYYASWMEGAITRHLDDADLVVFTGGADVDPALYGRKQHPTTWPDRQRDDYEVFMFKAAQKMDKKMIGICRGAQFLCVMAGGTLIQHSSHPSVHYMHTDAGDITVTSTHHQRQYPYGGKKPNFNLIGWCTDLSPFNLGEPGQHLGGKPEVEIAEYPDIKALAIQSHPEMVYPTQKRWEENYIQFCRGLLDKHMGNKELGKKKKAQEKIAGA